MVFWFLSSEIQSLKSLWAPEDPLCLLGKVRSIACNVEYCLVLYCSINLILHLADSRRTHCLDSRLGCILNLASKHHRFMVMVFLRVVLLVMLFVMFCCILFMVLFMFFI